MICIGPSRPCSNARRVAIEDFVRGGGLLICLVGAEEAPASQALLRNFGFDVPKSPVRPGDPTVEPEPMGQFVTPYLNAAEYGQGDYLLEVMIYTGWPVAGEGGEGVELNTAGYVKQPTIQTLDRREEAVVYRERPLVLSRQIGKGRVVVIGDTQFALNKNLEYAGGEPFRGRYENAA